jgi:hypothetical protein
MNSGVNMKDLQFLSEQDRSFVATALRYLSPEIIDDDPASAERMEEMAAAFESAAAVQLTGAEAYDSE